MKDRQNADLDPVINESGIEIKPLYTPDDVERTGRPDDIGTPGEYPFTRGIHRQMNR
ncbi:MAG TPA: methylmalonyl-CoA mutase family protein, partial [Phycisphaerae bacterium]|nr:methylmalonyl-CoA mutase family protein [Phycisphaerae bacterium]